MQKHALSYGVHFNVTDTTRRLGQSGKKFKKCDKRGIFESELDRGAKLTCPFLF